MDLEDSLAPLTVPGVQLKYGVVTGTSGTSVIVTVEGASLTLRRLASYSSPTAGQHVVIAAFNGRWTVLGNLA